MSKESNNKFHCGYVAIIGKPNVGKSTIINKFLNRKISITSNKPQTTQKQILAVKTTENNQIIFLDTPGMHQDLIKHQKNTLSKYMSRAVSQALADVDIILFVISGTKYSDDDKFVLEQIKQANIPCVLVVNKIDKVKNKEDLLPFIADLTKDSDFLDVFYISALKENHLNKIEDIIIQNLPVVEDKNQFYFGEDYITDQNNRVFASEIIREKIIRTTNKEIPYGVAIEIEGFEEGITKKSEKILDIAAIIWVERKGQKIIIIGSKGENIKNIGQAARLDLEKQFNMKVHLKLWVKIKSDWSSDSRVLNKLGFHDE